MPKSDGTQSDPGGGEAKPGFQGNKPLSRR